MGALAGHGGRRLSRRRRRADEAGTSAGKASVLLRAAIIELGKGLTAYDEEFAPYRQRLIPMGHKPPGTAVVAAGRRAHRLAFVMLRSQQPYEPSQWQNSAITVESAPKNNNNKTSRSTRPSTPANGGGSPRR